MRRYALALLISLNIVLAGIIAWSWVTSSGTLRNMQWQAPVTVKPDLLSMLPALPGPGQADTSQFLRMLERPLFSATRRPPPPPPPPKVEVPEPVNWFAQAKLTGVYEGPAGGGVIIFYEGKDRRVPLNGYLDGWKLQSVSGAQASFEKSGQTRVVPLQRAALATYTGLPQNRPPAQPSAAPVGRDGGLQPPAQPPSGVGGSASPAAENRPRASFGGGR
jgi:hypothetical protein